MKASENFKIQGYLQLFMAFWPKGHPDVKFYMAMNFDFTKPVTEDVLKTFLEASGKLCEEQNLSLIHISLRLPAVHFDTGLTTILFCPFLTPV